MALVTVEQTDIDQLAADLDAAVTNVGSELADVEAQLAAAIAAGNPPPAGSLDGVRTALASLQALEVPAVTPPA